MKLAKEPKEVDLLIKSEPWTEKDLADFRELMKEIKTKNKRRKMVVSKKTAKPSKVSESL